MSRRQTLVDLGSYSGIITSAKVTMDGRGSAKVQWQSEGTFDLNDLNRELPPRASEMVGWRVEVRFLKLLWRGCCWRWWWPWHKHGLEEAAQ